MRISTTLRLLVALLLVGSFASGCQTMTGRSTGR
jgi:predicted small secreted protein